MAKNSEEILGSLQKLNAALIANAVSLPNIEAERQRFNQMLNATLEAFTRQGSLTSEKQEASQTLHNLLTETSRLATSLRFSVKSLYGIRSEKLLEFGMKPFRGRKPALPLQPTPTPDPDPDPVDPGPTVE
jgi:hypothetical protein